MPRAFPAQAAWPGPLDHPRRGGAVSDSLARAGGRWRDLYRLHSRDPHRERRFLASLGFLLTFVVTRAITHRRRPRAPLTAVRRWESHRAHHLVWGILLL